MSGVEHDVVIRGATVIDGSGGEPFEADVACADGIITRIGAPQGRATEELDGRGLVLAPGFVDPHTHLDANLFWDPDLTPSSSYGVTTVVMTNCGYGLAPVEESTRDFVVDTMSGVEQIPREALLEGVPWDWRTLRDYFARLRRTPSLLNFGVLTGHVPLRAAAMGVDAACTREATPSELERLAGLLDEAQQLGSLGFSTDQVEQNVGAHGARLPGQVCGEAELLALARVLRSSPGPGIFALAPREMLADRGRREADLDGHFRLAAASGRPVVVGPVFDLWHDPGGALALIEGAHARSNDTARVVTQVSTRPFELWTRLDEPGLLVRSLPTLSKAVRQDGAEGARAVAAGSELRAAVRAEGDQMRSSPVFSGRWDHVRLRFSDTRGDLVGQTLQEAAGTAGCHPTDLLLDLALADDFATQVATAMANADDDAIAAQLGLAGSMIGASDAGAHVTSNTDSCYAVWTLQHWVRERGVLTLPEAVRKLTSEPAALFGFSDRGRVAEGLAADLVLMDADRIGVTGVEYVADQPAGGRRLVARATGVAASLVGGVVSTRDGVSTGARSGRLLIGR